MLDGIFEVFPWIVKALVFPGQASPDTSPVLCCAVGMEVLLCLGMHRL